AKLAPKSSNLLETESVFNDATGITTFTLLLTSLDVSRLSLIDAAVSFASIFGGGVIVGLLVALGAHLLSRIVTDPMSETMITITTVYGSYTVASALDFSGIVAVAIAEL